MCTRLVNRLNQVQPVHEPFDPQCSAYVNRSIFNFTCLNWHTLTSTVSRMPAEQPVKHLKRVGRINCMALSVRTTHIVPIAAVRGCEGLGARCSENRITTADST